MAHWTTQRRAKISDESQADKPRLGTIRLALQQLQREVDERITLNDDDIIAILVGNGYNVAILLLNMNSANRQDLADVEKAEITVLEGFMPQPLTEEEVVALLDSAIAEAQPAGMQDMGKSNGYLETTNSRACRYGKS